MLPPFFIICEASLATSVKEKHDTSMLFKKFSLVVFKYSPDNSDLSEKATAWTTKSICPHFALISWKSLTISSLFSTLQLSVNSEFKDLANGTTLFFKASPRYVNANSAPASASFCDMPQAIDRSLATPIINPFLPLTKLIYTFSKINVAFVPPNPKLLDIIAFKLISFSVLSTIGNFFASSSISLILADPVIKLFFIIIKL